MVENSFDYDDNCGEFFCLVDNSRKLEVIVTNLLVIIEDVYMSICISVDIKHD